MRVTKLSLFLLAATTLILGGCKDTDRPLNYEKGVYRGMADKPLAREQLDALRQRGNYQKD
ncbi:MAG: hypothetical protein OEM91_11065 [Hyphomicrobiales bacterium]|nr:hypothetical protein [Hyphomicrobiales bacterium]